MCVFKGAQAQELRTPEPGADRSLWRVEERKALNGGQHGDDRRQDVGRQHTHMRVGCRGWGSRCTDKPVGGRAASPGGQPG